MTTYIYMYICIFSMKAVKPQRYFRKRFSSHKSKLKAERAKVGLF